MTLRSCWPERGNEESQALRLPPTLCHPERSCRSRSERQRSRRTPSEPGLPMASQGVFPRQMGAVSRRKSLGYPPT